MKKRKKLEIGYLGALQMANTAADGLWQAFTSMIAANALLAALGALALTVLPQWAPLGVAVVGLIVCCAWHFSARRHFSYYKFYINWARSLEKRLLAPDVTMLEQGRHFGAGAKVRIPKAGRWQMPWSAKVFKIERLVTTTISVFALLYVGLLVLALTHPVPLAGWPAGSPG